MTRSRRALDLALTRDDLAAIDAALAKEHALRRYGFHGTSHEYVSARVPERPARRRAMRPSSARAAEVRVKQSRK